MSYLKKERKKRVVSRRGAHAPGRKVLQSEKMEEQQKLLAGWVRSARTGSADHTVVSEPRRKQSQDPGSGEVVCGQ